jgi:hypothetical protein
MLYIYISHGRYIPIHLCTHFNTDIKFNDRDSSLLLLPGARLARSVRRSVTASLVETHEIVVRIAYVLTVGYVVVVLPFYDHSC